MCSCLLGYGVGLLVIGFTSAFSLRLRPAALNVAWFSSFTLSIGYYLSFRAFPNLSLPSYWLSSTMMATDQQQQQQQQKDSNSQSPFLSTKCCVFPDQTATTTPSKRPHNGYLEPPDIFGEEHPLYRWTRIKHQEMIASEKALTPTDLMDIDAPPEAEEIIELIQSCIVWLAITLTLFDRIHCQ